MRVKTSVCSTYRIYPFKTDVILCSCHRGIFVSAGAWSACLRYHSAPPPPSAAAGGDGSSSGDPSASNWRRRDARPRLYGGGRPRQPPPPPPRQAHRLSGCTINKAACQREFHSGAGSDKCGDRGRPRRRRCLRRGAIPGASSELRPRSADSQG